MKKIGRYDVVEELGRGAMGVVYKASDPTIGRLVAIKVLSLDSPKQNGIPGPQDIFLREARAAGRLSHPGIVTIHDALEDPETKSHYIVMELVRGRTLESILLSGSSLSIETSLDISRQIAEALEYAHQQKIVHRDLKPANILVSDDGHIKITDFGIAKILALEGAQRTAAIMGTPAYMSPEQVTGGEADARTDLFSLGVLLYLMLAGEKPFTGDTAAVMFKIAYEDPVPPSRLRPDVADSLDYLVLRCLAKDRNKRYASAREFLDDLDDLQQGKRPRSEASFPLSEIRAAERTLVAREGTQPWGGQLAPAPARRWAWMAGGIGVGFAMVLASIGVAFLIYRARRHPAVPAPFSESRPAAQPAAAQPGAAPPSPAPVTNPGEAARLKSPSASPSPESAVNPQPTRTNSTTVAPPLRPSPLEENESTASSPRPPSAHVAAKAKPVVLICHFDLPRASLTVTSEGGPIFQATLSGRKKSRFLGLKGGYAGDLLRRIPIAAGTRNLFVHIVSSDGAFDEEQEIDVGPASKSPATLHVDVKGDRLRLRWAGAATR